ncbi:MAG TPA: type VI secretion system protein TssL, long form [Paraburkholderia sp.]|nr:type VI secretion system protein TssL, long form [Paraburkholderia sp.]
MSPHAPYARPAARPSGTPPAEPFATRITAVRDARSPLLEAARPLLRALADMPDALDERAAVHLRALLKQEVHAFTRVCEQANIRHDHMIGARYCLTTALDSAAVHTSWGTDTDAGAAWAKDTLTTDSNDDLQGGDKVFLLIGRLLTEPDEHFDLLQVIYRILSLGFMGRYAHEADGARTHEAVRQRLYAEIRARHAPLPSALSPHARSDARARRMSLHEFPVWITVALLALLLCGLFGFYKYQLVMRSRAVVQQIADIASLRPATLRPLRLATLLKEEIAAGTVRVVEDTRRSVVTFRGDAMFAPGSTATRSTIAPLIDKIAGEIARVPGKVTVIGYTDTTPIRSRQFASNLALSEERATHVMQMLQTAGVAAGRLEALGKGAADPVDDNRTAQGRAQNRRVEIAVVR